MKQFIILIAVSLVIFVSCTKKENSLQRVYTGSDSATYSVKQLRLEVNDNTYHAIWGYYDDRVTMLRDTGFWCDSAWIYRRMDSVYHKDSVQLSKVNTIGGAHDTVRYWRYTIRIDTIFAISRPL